MALVPPQRDATPAASVDALWDLLPEAGEPHRARAFDSIAAQPDPRHSYPLLDLLRLADTPAAWYRALDGLGKVVGRDLRDVERPWRTLREEWSSSPPPLPDDYLAWKGELLAQSVDERFRELLADGRRVAPELAPHDVVWGGVGVDGLPDLTRPPTTTAAGADFLTPDEAVFGVVLDGQARAYPLRILDWHELVNDVVAGRPVALTWCTLCGAAILYDARVDGQALEFGTSGLLARSNKLMYDKTTRSLWSQATGRPVVGPRVDDGVELDVLPLVATSWARWRERHPDTDVVALPTSFDRRYEPGAAYGEYFGARTTWFPVGDGRFERAPKSLVFVVRAAGSPPRAYPLDELAAAGGHVRDELGGEPIVVLGPTPRPDVALPAAWRDVLGLDSAQALTSAAAERLAADPELLSRATERALLASPRAARLVLLEALGRPDTDAGRVELRALRDRVTNRDWAVDVRAYRVRRRGDDVSSEPETLERLPGHLMFWFAWRGSLAATGSGTTWSR